MTKSFTDIEQSKKLAEILPLESADMCYIQDLLAGGKYGEYKPYVGDLFPAYGQDKIKCWSLAALLDVLPPIEGFHPIIDLDINLVRYEGDYRDKLCFNGKNLIDACYEMILKLHELNLV